MNDLRMISLFCLTVAAVLDDLWSGRISNAIIVTGILWGGASQLFLRGAAGLLFFLGGLCLPAVLFAAVFYFRMLGAGDIKLMCAAGSFMGPSVCFSFIVYSVLFGAVISLAIMVRRHTFGQRLIFFSKYFNEYSREKQWKSYLENTDTEAKFCFSIPVLLSVLCFIGGRY